MVLMESGRLQPISRKIVGQLPKTSHAPMKVIVIGDMVLPFTIMGIVIFICFVIFVFEKAHFSIVN